LALARATHDSWLVGVALGHLGLVMCAQGDPAGARTALQEALALTQESGNRWDMAWLEAGLGNVYLAQHEATQAEVHFGLALQLAAEADALSIALDALAGLAALRAQLGDRPRAVELAAHVSVHPASSSIARTQAGEILKAGDADCKSPPPAPSAAALSEIVRGILAMPTRLQNDF
jgi:tetratricopeptide (TPR) repeat protein